MSGPDTHDDDGLDAMLASLGAPEGATPVTSPAEILARAAALGPPVAVGLGGWKLAAALLITLGGGFLGGWWFGRDRAPELATAPPVPAAPRAPDAATVQAPIAAAENDPLASIDAIAPHLAPKILVARGQERGSPKTRDRAPATEGLAPALASSCPEPAATPTFEDLSAWLGDMPPGQTELPAAPPEAEEARVATAAREDEDDATTRTTSEKTARNLAIRASVGPLIAPAVSTGLRTELSLLRAPDAAARAGFAAGGDLGVALINGPLGATWNLDLGAEASRVRRFGGAGRRNAELGLGWTAGARLLVPARHADNPAAEPGAEPALEAPKLLPMTGPRLALSLGDPSATRLNLSFSAQLGPTVEQDGLQPWFSLGVGGVVPTFKKKDG